MYNVNKISFGNFGVEIVITMMTAMMMLELSMRTKVVMEMVLTMMMRTMMMWRRRMNKHKVGETLFVH